MSGYLSSRKLGNVKGRIKYITDEKKQENIVDYYNTTNIEFWELLAKESRLRHKETKAKGKCCEARELIIGIPQNSKITAKQICDTFKNKYSVECACSIHYNTREIDNKHCHLIFSERKKLDIPEQREEKRAIRTYYYDEKGHKCKKSEAVKIVKKGTILQKGMTRYFTDKNEYFKTQKFVYECKKIFLKELLHIDWSLAGEKQNKELSEKHIGKNNPKAKYIKQNNELKAMLKSVCNASDFVVNVDSGTTLKDFKRHYQVNNFSAVNYEENKRKVSYFVKTMQSVYKDRVRNEIRDYNYTNDDINILNEDDYNLIPMQRNIITHHEEESKTRDKPKVIEYLKEKLVQMLERIQKLIHLQDDLYIDEKKQIDIEENSRTNKLSIKHSDEYIKQKENDFEMEL